MKIINLKKLHAIACLALLLGSSWIMAKEQTVKNSAFTVLGGGCFWCTEALYETLDGVLSVEPGYAGGTVPNPSYQQVTSGKTGHAEVIKIEYDPAKVSFAEIIDFFWQIHDPTTLNRQGADVGHHYRSIILFQNDDEKAIAEKSKAEAQPAFKNPIVTEIVPLDKFYIAENYHRDYFANNSDAPYCRFVIAPKLKKLEKN